RSTPRYSSHSGSTSRVACQSGSATLAKLSILRSQPLSSTTWFPLGSENPGTSLRANLSPKPWPSSFGPNTVEGGVADAEGIAGGVVSHACQTALSAPTAKHSMRPSALIPTAGPGVPTTPCGEANGAQLDQEPPGEVCQICDIRESGARVANTSKCP